LLQLATSQTNRLLIVIIHKELLHNPLHFPFLLLFPSQPPAHPRHLVKETEDLASNVLPPGLLVVHDSSRGGEDDVAELTRWEQLDDPLLEVTELDVVAGGDDTGLVDPEFNRQWLRQVVLGKMRIYLPLSWTTILPLRWSSTSSNSPM
jgi:hypothetical protein